MNVAAIRRGVAANLEAIPGSDIRAYAPGDPWLPCVFVQVDSIEYQTAFGAGLYELELLVVVMVALATDRGGQDLMDEYLSDPGDRSVKAALMADTTIGGAARDLSVIRVDAYRAIPRPALEPALSAVWTIGLMAEGVEG